MTHALVAETSPEAALADLGVRPELISAEERRCLDIDGLVILKAVVAEDRRRYIRERIDAMLEAQQPGKATDADIRRRAARRLQASAKTLEKYEASSDALRNDLGPEKFEESVSSMKRKVEELRRATTTDDVQAMRTLMEQSADADAVDDDVFESDPVFDLPLQSPRVLSAVVHVLGPMFHIENVVARCPRPGKGHQILHRTTHGPRRIANTLWLIDDMTLENGPTRIVPGSHVRSDGLPKEMEDDPTRTHPDEIKITAPAGSVIVFDDRCWHGGTQNNGREPRRVLICPFMQRALYPGMKVKHPEKTLARMSPGQRWILHPGFEPQEA